MSMPSRLLKLPAELLLLVLPHLSILDLAALILAEYALLRRFQIVANLPLLAALTDGNRGQAWQLLSTSIAGMSSSQGFPLPTELWLHIDPMLSTDDKINLATAMWPILALRWNVGLRKR